MQAVHSLIAQDSKKDRVWSSGESLAKTGRKDEAQVCARELDEMGLTARAESMTTVKGG